LYIIQSGPSDRFAAIIKSHVRRYLNEGHDITTAAEFVRACMSNNGVKNVHVFECQLTPGTQKDSFKLNEITKLNNFSFGPDRILAHRAWDVGCGKSIQLDAATGRSLTITSLVRLKSTAFQLVSPPSSTTVVAKETVVDTEETVLDTKETDVGQSIKPRLFECNEEGCVCLFHRHGNLLRHIATGNHVRRLEKLSLTDTAMKLYKSKLEDNDNQRTLSLELEKITFNPSQFRHLASLQKGWALPAPRTVTNLSPRQKQFLTEKFNDGLLRGVRWQPEAVAEEIKRLKDDRTGKFTFTVSEFLKVSTVRSFFSRHNARTKLLPNICSPTSAINEASTSPQVQMAEDDGENDESDDEEAYQEQMAIDVEIDRVVLTNMVKNDPDINAKRPFGTLQSEQDSVSNKTPRLQRSQRGEN
jgi:hypothetical protein